MDPLWYEFRSSPASFLSKNRTNVEALVHDLLQILYADDKSNTLKLNVLGILQECGSFLLDDVNRLELVLGTLKNIFKEQRNSQEPLYIPQVLVTITSLLLQSQYLENIQPYLMDIISLLLTIIEKPKMETNRLLRATACDCLKEIELAIPGILCDTVGYLYGMTQVENSYVHQHYMGLFATVLSHYVQKITLMNNDSGLLPEDGSGAANKTLLSDILFHDGRQLPAFEPPAKYWKMAKLIATKSFDDESSITKLPDTTDLSELKKGIGYLVDHCHLFTTHFIVQVIHQVIRIIQCSNLSPGMLKSLLLRYTSCYDIELWHMILQMKLLFSNDICDDKDENVILRRLITMSGHPSLSPAHSALVLQWLLQLRNEQLLPDMNQMSLTPLQPLIFDTDDIIWFKVLLLSSLYNEESTTNEEIQVYFRALLGSLQKPVLYGIGGSTCRLLYRTMLLFCECFGDDMKKHVERSAVEILIAHAKFTPQSLDLMSLVDRRFHDESMSGSILSEACQWLLSLEISVLCFELENHLSLCITAAKSKIVWSQIPLQILKKVISESPVCQEGDWSIGNAILAVLCTLMTVLPSDGMASKDLANLLLTMSTSFMDIDIRDRARIYLQILLTVSKEKLSALLSMESESDSYLSQAAVAGISNNVYPQSPSIKVIDELVFTLERMEYSHSKWPTTADSLSSVEYYQWLREKSDLFVLRIPCTITLSGNKPGIVSDRVYAIVLQFSTSAPYHKPQDIHIPSLTLREEVQFDLVVEAVKPLPASFNVRGIFTHEDGDTYTCSLESIQLSFCQLFHSPPVDHSKEAFLFNQLWNSITEQQHSKTCPDNEGVLSVTRLSNDCEGFLNALQTTLSSLCVSLCHSNEDKSSNILLFLPPHYHVLLKCLSGDDSSTVVRIACDNWMLLPFIGEWLKGLQTV